MVSQRYLDFRKFIGVLWHRILRYWLVLNVFGMLIGIVFSAVRDNIVLFTLVWQLSSISITYVAFFFLYKPTRDLDGDY